jgi:hypothetical protein
MDSKDREYLKKALKHYHHSMEESLSKAISEEENGPEGFKRYMRLMNEIRAYARSKQIDDKRAAKELSS